MTGKRRGGSALLAALLASCGEPAPTAQEPPGLTVTLHSEDVVDGARATLTLSCSGGSASFWLELRGGEAPPPAYGHFKLDDGIPLRLELVPLGAGRWAPRLDDASETRLAAAMASARNIYFAGPEGRSDRVIRWDLGRLGRDAGRLRDACFSPAPP